MLHFQARFVLDASCRVSRCSLFLSTLLTLVGGACSVAQDTQPNDSLSLPFTAVVPDTYNVVRDGIQAVIDEKLAPQTRTEGLRVAARELDVTVDRETAAMQREEIFSDLSGSMLQLQAQSAVLRKIVQAVRPSVVHVIADKKPEIDRADLPPGEHFEFPPDALVEEAGSGVIVEIDQKPYVLTNRHVIKGAEASSYPHLTGESSQLEADKNVVGRVHRRCGSRHRGRQSLASQNR